MGSDGCSVTCLVVKFSLICYLHGNSWVTSIPSISSHAKNLYCCLFLTRLRMVCLIRLQRRMEQVGINLFNEGTRKMERASEDLRIRGSILGPVRRLISPLL